MKEGGSTMTLQDDPNFIEKLKDKQEKDEKNRKHQGHKHPEEKLPNHKH
jgi:hypothetical protein